MKRLTKVMHCDDGNKLYDYSNEVVRECKDFSSRLELMFEKLAHYEDLEEQGLLLKLPCKVGDTVYKLWYSNGIPYRIQELKIRTLENVVSIVKHNLLGERVFLTKEEAEAKLKEMRCERCVNMQNTIKTIN